VQNLTPKHAADVGDTRRFSRLEQLAPNCACDGRELLACAIQQIAGYGIALSRGHIHQARESGNLRTRELGRVEAMKEIARVRPAESVEQHPMQRRRWSPTLFKPQRGSQCLAR
jgi:hypothetical protein